MRNLMKTAAAAGAVLFLGAAAQASDVKEVHQTLKLDSDGRLTVNTYKGTLTVTTWDRPEVKIDARIEPGDTDRESIEKVQWTEVRISGGGSGVEVRSDYDRVKEHEHLFGFFDHDVLPLIHYTIQMPATARLEVDDYKSESRVSDLKADLSFHTYKGRVRVENLDGAARVETYKGDVHVDFARYSKASRFESYKGEITVSLPKDSRFELDAEGGRHGVIDSDFATLTRTSRRYSAQAEGAVNGGGPTLRMTTTKGTLRLRGR